jgi:uncharacterized membrane protein YeaQ/YmgE (transglycosylase-associated protein family)
VSDLVVFALIGVLAGAAARLWYPGREPMKVLGTMLLGMGGSVAAGLIGWTVWPPLDGQLYVGALLTSLLGAVLLLVLWPCVVYARSGGRPVLAAPALDVSSLVK